MAVVSALIDLILPPRKSERMLRELSRETLQSLERGEGLPYHDPRVTALIWELKYYGTRRARRLAGEHLAEQLLALGSEVIGRPLIIPVPMHPARRKERGHNQTELLCEAALGAFSKERPPFEYAPAALERVVDTKHQQGLPQHLRLRNVQGSMRARAEIADRVCIVVDDVATTGATLREAKRALQEGGARVVHCVALARS